MDIVTTFDEVSIIEALLEDAPTFYFYQFERKEGTETAFLFKVEGAETGVVLGMLASREKEEKAFELLQFEKVE